jgi:hypothetical protein
MSCGRSLCGKGRFQRSGGSGGLSDLDHVTDANSASNVSETISTGWLTNSRLSCESWSSVRNTVSHGSPAQECSSGHSISHSLPQSQGCSMSPPTHRAGTKRSAQTRKSEVKKRAMTIQNLGRSKLQVNISSFFPTNSFIRRMQSLDVPFGVNFDDVASASTVDRDGSMTVVTRPSWGLRAPLWPVPNFQLKG